MIGINTIWLKKVDSTNTYLHQLLKNNKIEEGTIIVAEEQTMGRGQRENKWESQSGMNLTFSFILYPEILAVEEQFMISKFVSLSIADLISKYKSNVRIKWPNDIYVGRKKIGGILIENTIKGSKISSSIIGIGLNINQLNFGKDLLSATSLSIETKSQYNINSVLEELIIYFNKRYNELILNDFNKLNLDYINSLYQFNEYQKYKTGDKFFTGKITGIDNDGRLCLQTNESEILKFAFKEIEFL
jgi:BirA family transcriptional regulator, biotin operon repressor / biotin---[acetyl-CoA-carboxylase] ligase